MIFWLLSCSSPTEKVISSSKYLTLYRASNDDLIETVLSALRFHQMLPDTVIYHPKQQEFVDEIKRYITNCNIIPTRNLSLSSIPETAQSVLILTNTKEISELQTSLQVQLEIDSYITWESTKSWGLFHTDVKTRITPLQPKKRFSLTNVPEPSGLAIHPKTSSLWTVSDETGMIIDLGIDARSPDIPHAHNAFQVTEFEDNDLEGIAFIKDKTCVVVESQRRLLCYDDSFQKVSDQKIEGPYTPEKDNKGPEGLSDDGIILNEGFPTAIANTGRILSVGTDISGIAKDGDQYWILSQTDGTITLVDSKYKTQKVYGFPDDGLEGIAVQNSSLFVISDPNEVLYEIKKP